MAATIKPRSNELVIDLPAIKAQCRVDIDDDDQLLTDMALAAQRMCEGRIGGPLLTADCVETLSAWPVTGYIVLEVARAQEVTKFYVRTRGERVEFADFHAVLQDRGTLLVLAPNGQWPLIDERLDAIEIEYTAGFGDTPDAVPEDVKQWLLYTVSTMYSYREEFVTGASVQELPSNFVDRQINRYKPVRVSL